MKNKSSTKKKPPSSKSSRNKPRVSLEQDPFFTRDSKRRRRADEEIESNESDQDGVSPGEEEEEEEHGGGRSEFAAETADLERHRVAKMFLDNFREQTKRAREEEDETDEDEDENNRDSLVAEMLLKEQLEESGRARKLIASRVQKPDKIDGFQALVRHRQSVTAVALADGD
ncbi:hypothetical protein Scep_012218 [Stephania cephalantha]|uniref:Uncharacterized protein n=1 Tax=Stephania cephalantha TaxID=152367 RepID=A0AAP0JGQ3_9MAGN